MDYKQERQSDVDKILCSNHPRKVVVAGPGTGKSFLFEQAIKKELAKRPSDSEVYQFLVALTRAKKRMYLINTGGKPVSGFIDYRSPERIETKSS